MSGVRRAQQARAIEKKKLILDAATELLLEGGLRAVTHRQVAARAGVPVGSIGYYYNTREELLETAIEKIGDTGHDYAESIAPEASTSLSTEEAADLIIRTFLGGEPTNQKLLSWLCATVDCARESQSLHDEMARNRETRNADLTRILADTGYATIGARTVTSTIGGALVLCMYEQAPNSLEFVQDSVIELLETHGS